MLPTVATAWLGRWVVTMTIVNMTPHALILLVEEDEGPLMGFVGYGAAAALAHFRIVAELQSAGIVRAATSVVPAGEVTVDGEIFPVTVTKFGEVSGLPAPTEETTFVVSLIAAQAAAAGGRSVEDLLTVGETVRDEGGRIIGALGFGRLA